MDSVIIYPPYDVASCRGKNGDNQAVEHVKKIVSIYIILFFDFITNNICFFYQGKKI